MGLSGDFAALKRLAAQAASLAELPARVAAEASPKVQDAVQAQLAPGMGNGWAPGLTVSAQGGSLAIDSGEPSRLPVGIPVPDDVEQLLEGTAQQAFALATGGG